MKNKMEILRNITMIGQLGLSLTIPVLLCLAICYFLVTRTGIGAWIYIIGFLFGLGASFMTAYKVYLSVTGKAHRDKGEDEGFSVSKHI